MTEFNFKNIISGGELKDFILGYNNYKTYRPEEDTKKWSDLNEYYKSLESNEADKVAIKNGILNLFYGNSELEKRVSLILCRTMNFPEIEIMLKDYLEKNELDHIDKLLQIDIWITVCYLQIESLSAKVAKFIVDSNSVRMFLLTSKSRTNENEVSTNDLWRIGIISKFYEGANISVRKKIEIQLTTLIGKSRKIDSIIRSFVQKESNDNFKVFLKKQLFQTHL